MKEGVTVVINCYNSEQLISETLRHLGRQKNEDNIPWEVILIDDNSSDKTSERARQIWAEADIAPLRIFRENGIGKMNAIFKSFREANYEYISIIDDDNWVEEEWIRKVHQFFQTHPDYGVLGAASEGVLEGEAPDWFEQFKKAYAIGKQAEHSGEITDVTPVWGAGSNYRRQPMLYLLDKGWQPLIPGPKGRKRAAGEDIEMCMGVKLLGWKIYFDENLHFEHYMPASRTTWQSLLKMKAATGRARLVMDHYRMVDQGRYDENGRPAISWSQKVVEVLKALAGKPKWVAKSMLKRKEGDWYLLYLEENYYFLLELLKHRKRYYETIHYLVRMFGRPNEAQS